MLNPNRSSISISSHRDDRMDAALLSAVRERPRDPDARNALGNHLLAQGQPQSATQCFQEAIALEPRFAEAHFNLGNAARVQGDSREAAFRRARKDRLYRDTGFITALEDFYASLVSGDHLEPLAGAAHDFRSNGEPAGDTISSRDSGRARLAGCGWPTRTTSPDDWTRPSPATKMRSARIRGCTKPATTPGSSTNPGSKTLRLPPATAGHCSSNPNWRRPGTIWDGSTSMPARSTRPPTVSCAPSD